MAILLACLAMALRDMTGTWLTIAQSHGRAGISGVLDGVLDIANILVVLAGAGNVLNYGWTLNTIVILAAMMVTSIIGTWLWTKTGTMFLGRAKVAKLDPQQPTIDELEARVSLLETKRASAEATNASSAS